MLRLPADDPARTTAERNTRPRFAYVARNAWLRAQEAAEASGEPPPPKPDEDAVLPNKPCFRRVSQWIANEAGIASLPREELAHYKCPPPWLPQGRAPAFITELPTPTRRTDPPEARRAAALRALALLPPADTTVWSDGSAAEGTRNGGAGAIIQFHSLNREETVTVPAGAVCSSLRAELTAMRAYVARNAWLRAQEAAEASGEPPPPKPDEDAVLPNKPCFPPSEPMDRQ